MLVYVLNKHGDPLMPCRPQRARKLLKSGKARVVKKVPFTIQLIYGASGYRQDVSLGIDAGSKHIGVSATTDDKVLFEADVEVRNDIVDLLKRIEDLEKQLEVRKGEQYIPEFPEFKSDGEDTWHVNNVLRAVTYGITMGKVDDYNFFHTKEYADEFAKNCKIIAMMLHCKWYLDRNYVPNWDDVNEIKWDVHFDCNSNKFVFESWRHKMASGVYFSSDAAARKCADWLNEHWKKSGDE